MSEAGIDTKVFKAHSTRSAPTSDAKNRYENNLVVVLDFVAVANLHSNFNVANLAPKGRFGFLDVGPFWLHTGAKTEHLGHSAPDRAVLAPI